MSVSALIEPVTGKPGPVQLSEAANWLQGRTLYGGASTLIGYTMALRAFPDLPPLRAAQVGFVAPVGDEVELSAEIVRQGRNVTQIRSEIHAQGKLAHTALWLFAEPREANAVHPGEKPDDFPPQPEDCEDVMTGKGPSFIQCNFDLKRAQDTSGPGAPIVRRWARLKQTEDLDPVSELILMGDVLPPGAMRAMRRTAPISSINWSFNLLDTEPRTSDGWWLSENASQHAGDGYSSERLRLWNTQGEQVLDALQSVAIFG
ncbi:thioesterase family protein [Altererythrobacter sp.]|uniref:thioesterase family protein n=1 Tax=Altererythrobacter sp. TaxID=1872480 RepID=UPI003D089E80